MKKATLLILFILINFNTFCQNKIPKDIYSVTKLEVGNSNLFSTLDTIIQMKENIQWHNGPYFFIIEFGEDSIRSDLVFVREYETIYYYYPDIVGFFDYKNHVFIVKGCVIDTMLFQRASETQDFYFGFPPNRFTKNGEPIVQLFEAYAIWSMRYKQKNLKILSFYTPYNKNDTWFNNIDKEYGG